MKRINILTLGFLAGLCCLAAPALFAQEATVVVTSLVAVLKKDGTIISEKERTVFKETENGLEFRYQDQPVRLLYHLDQETGINVTRVESPLLKDGTLCIGIAFPSERHLPGVTVKDKRASFKNKDKTVLAWTADAEFVPPSPRKKLEVSLAEYGGADKWVDVTAQVRKLQSNDTLDFTAGNALFGDPVGGVVKSFMLTYTLSDEDDEEEIIGNFSENQQVRIQHDPKQSFFRLVVKDVDAFEFVTGSGKLPKTLPTFTK